MWRSVPFTRWMADFAFKQAVVGAESEVIDAATRRLVGMQDKAIDILDEILKGGKGIRNSLKLRAAQSVLDYLLKIRELRDLEERLTALEGELLERKL